MATFEQLASPARSGAIRTNGPSQPGVAIGGGVGAVADPASSASQEAPIPWPVRPAAPAAPAGQAKGLHPADAPSTAATVARQGAVGTTPWPPRPGAGQSVPTPVAARTSVQPAPQQVRPLPQAHAGAQDAASLPSTGTAPTADPAAQGLARAVATRSGEAVFSRDREAREAVRERERRSRKADEGRDSPFGAAVHDRDRLATREGRRDIHAANILTRLVQALIAKPGSGVPNAMKSALLGKLLKSTRDAAERLATSLAPHDAHRGWVMASATKTAVELVAAQWERDEFDEVTPADEQVAALEDVFREASRDQSLQAALELISENDYREATDGEIATLKVELSARAAAWELYGWVTDARLGGRNGYRYTYDRTAAEIVELLLPAVIDISRECNLRCDNLELRTVHMQSSLHRVATVMGAEYVARTRGMMDWCVEAGISKEEERSRIRQAAELLEARVVPELVEWTRRNHMNIETAAARMIAEEVPREAPVHQRPTN